MTLAVLLAVLGVVFVSAKVSSLVLDLNGAPALRFLHWVTGDWWDGEPVYGMHRSGMVYPPATWLLLGLFHSWSTLEVARWTWAAVALVALAALGAACASAVRRGEPAARACAWLAPFSMPALGDALEVGSLIVVLLPAAVGAVLLAAQHGGRWSTDLAAAAMFDLALAGPFTTLPFLAPLAVMPRSVRPAILALCGYGLVTVASALKHPGRFGEDMRLWMAHVCRQAGHGYGNVQDWLWAADADWAFAVSSLALLATLTVFVWWCRHSDVWLLLGVSATASRFWMAPSIGDDALLIIPMLALARLASADGVSRRLLTSARIALVLMALVLWIPLQFHFAGSTLGPLTVGPELVGLFNAAHVAVSLLALLVLSTGAVAGRS